MSRVEEIEAAIDSLLWKNIGSSSRWFREREQRRWDDQLDADSSVGRLAFLLDEAGRIREEPCSGVAATGVSSAGSGHPSLRFRRVGGSDDRFSMNSQMNPPGNGHLLSYNAALTREEGRAVMSPKSELEITWTKSRQAAALGLSAGGHTFPVKVG